MRSLLVLGALLLAAPASAETLTVTCTAQDPPTASARQFCIPAIDYKFDVPTRTTGVRLRMTAPASHCAPVIYHYQLKKADGTLLVGNTQPLNAGEFEEHDLGTGYRKIAVLKMEGIGVQGGCNEGFIHSWAVNLDTILY